MLHQKDKTKRMQRITGIVILMVLLISYFIRITKDIGSNYEVKDRLLGIFIFHNPFILALYALIASILLVKGMKRA